MSTPHNPQQPGPQQGHPYQQPQWQPQQPQGQMPGGQYPPANGQFPGGYPGGRPPKQKKPLLKRWWFWALVIVFLIIGFANLGGGGDDTTETASTSTTEEKPAAEESAAEEPTAEEQAVEEPAAEEKAATYAIGDAVAADGWEITVNEVKDGVSEVGNEFLSEKAQGQFVTVDISVKNMESSPEYFFEDNIKLADKDGNTYSSDSEAAMYADEESILFLEEINPGNTAKGVLVFDVPKDVSPDRLVFEGGIFSDPIEIALD